LGDSCKSLEKVYGGGAVKEGLKNLKKRITGSRAKSAFSIGAKGEIFPHWVNGGKQQRKGKLIFKNRGLKGPVRREYGRIHMKG